ncbi:unnamed protein product [Nesidiocoris tenuis]|uniref:Uncharacterized protein n=1 Tax=Nesidiocoris tenuis TaxID=355587 RepID=A0A6H5G869_9HEMI|nr:unnamed protein product [Nesidiocoris tenuis]
MSIRTLKSLTAASLDPALRVNPFQMGRRQEGYTSISVREPLSRILANRRNGNTNGDGSNAGGTAVIDPHYATVSDDSDEMYAAIEERQVSLNIGDVAGFGGCGGEYTSGSETYAQIAQPSSSTNNASNHPPNLSLVLHHQETGEWPTPPYLRCQPSTKCTRKSTRKAVLLQLPTPLKTELFPGAHHSAYQTNCPQPPSVELPSCVPLNQSELDLHGSTCTPMAQTAGR